MVQWIRPQLGMVALGLALTLVGAEAVRKVVVHLNFRIAILWGWLTEFINVKMERLFG